MTVSGGKPTLWGEFLFEVLTACKEAGLHTAVQTVGNYPFSQIEALLPLVNQRMVDVKTADASKFEEYVGRDLESVFAHIERLTHEGCSVVARTPVIGGFNDTRSASQVL